MAEDSASGLEDRILLLAPTKRDAAAADKLFASAGLVVTRCEDIAGLCSEMRDGAAVAILPEEAILGDREGCLRHLLGEQPPWSDFPLVVLMPAKQTQAAAPWLESVGHMTLVRRPIEIHALASLVRAALRDRRRQYAMRAALAEREEQARALREARDELERRVAERTAELARANAALREAMAARTELLRRLVTAQEDERRRLSRELHDGLGQELTALILGLKALEHAPPGEAPSRARLLELERIVDGIGRAAHDLAVDLRPSALDDIGLVSALAAYVERWSQRTGVSADFQPLGLGADRLPPEVETAVYRVVQEALNNVAKHAQARRVSILLTRQGGELTTLVEDEGRGFDPERAESGSGRRSLGLLGMRERVGLVGGTLVVESSEGEGTVVQARIPLDSPPGEAGHGGYGL